MVQSDRKTPVADACLRLRKMDTNAIVARTVSDRNGAFSFSVSEPGMYLVEAVDCGDDGVLAVSDALTLAQLPLTTLVVLPTTRGGGFLIEHGLPRDCRRLRRRHHRHRRRRPDRPQSVSSPEQ